MPAELRDDLTAMPAHRLAAAIVAGELTSAELTANCLARIRATNDKLHAFVAVYEDEAMAMAEARDREVRAPSSARSLLIAPPMPPPAPVTMADLSTSFFMPTGDPKFHPSLHSHAVNFP